MDTTLDNSIELAMIRSALFMFYLVAGARYFIFNEAKERSKYVLGVLLLLWSFELLKDAVSQFYPWFAITSIRQSYLLFDLLAIPLCTFYVMETICKHWINRRRFVLHLLPYILWLLVFVLFRSNVVYYMALCYPILYVACVAPSIFIHLQHYERSIADNYSYKENIDIKWIKTVIFLFLGNLLFCVYLYSRPSEVLFCIYYAYCLLIWCYIIYHNEKLQSPELLTQNENEQPEDEEEKMSSYTFSSSSVEKLRVCFEDEKLFLNPRLNIRDVAGRVGTNRTYLSRYLNNEMNVSFYDYVNGYRLLYAEKRLVQTDDKIVDIAQDSGFNSFATFLRSFKKQIGCTPKEYRRNSHAER